MVSSASAKQTQVVEKSGGDDGTKFFSDTVTQGAAKVMTTPGGKGSPILAGVPDTKDEKLSDTSKKERIENRTESSVA